MNRSTRHISTVGRRLALAASCAALACAAAASTPSLATDSPDVAAGRYGDSGFDTSGQDRHIQPGDDFYSFANGSAIARLVIPPDRAAVGTMTSLRALSETRVRLILEEAAAQTPAIPATPQGKAGAFYRAFLDEARIEGLGAEPIAADLQTVRAVRGRTDLAGLMALENQGAFVSMLQLKIDVDEAQPDRYAVHLAQAGLGLPDRDYYLEPQFAPQLALYRIYVARMLSLVGWGDPAGNADRIIALETRIAQASLPRVDQRDPDKIYNPITVAEIEEIQTGFPWAAFLAGAGLASVTRVVEQQKDAIAQIATLYRATPLDVLEAWEAFHVVDRSAPYLSFPFVQANFDFHDKGLTGQLQLQPRWKRAVQELNADMGEAIGQVYVARYFPPASKARVVGMAREIQTAFRRRIEALDWMSRATKVEALRKLDAYDIKVGYPDHWRDYAALRIRPDDLVGDVRRSAAFDWDRRVRRLDRPVDRSEWGLPPQVLQAYNDPARNELLFTAAVLQAPLFDVGADLSINYGGIGAVIGHEMTHGFDDQGRKFDATGRLRDWWAPRDADRFRARADRLVAQFNAYAPLNGGPHVNGRLTLGENIADLGGVNLALDAYHAATNGKPIPIIDGYTGEQRIFLGWAQAWRGRVRDERLRRLLAMDPHSPDQYRVNGVVRNIDAWYTAYRVRLGEGLYLSADQRVRIW